MAQGFAQALQSYWSAGGNADWNASGNAGNKKHPHGNRNGDEALIVFLSAPLGGGKTTFCQFVLRELGWQETVPSPTYGMLHPYRVAGMHLLHLDAYRLNKQEFAELFDSILLAPKSVLLIEWPEKIGSVPRPDLLIQISLTAEADTREWTLNAKSQPGEYLLQQLRESAKSL